MLFPWKSLNHFRVKSLANDPKKAKGGNRTCNIISSKFHMGRGMKFGPPSFYPHLPATTREKCTHLSLTKLPFLAPATATSVECNSAEETLSPGIAIEEFPSFFTQKCHKFSQIRSLPPPPLTCPRYNGRNEVCSTHALASYSCGKWQ